MTNKVSISIVLGISMALRRNIRVRVWLIDIDNGDDDENNDIARENSNVAIVIENGRSVLETRLVSVGME